MSYRQLLNTATGLINSNLLPVSGTPYINEEQLIVANEVINLSGSEITQNNFLATENQNPITFPSAWLQNYNSIQETITYNFSACDFTASGMVDPNITVQVYMSNLSQAISGGELAVFNSSNPANCNLNISGNLDIGSNPQNVVFQGTHTIIDYFTVSGLPNPLTQYASFKILNSETAVSGDAFYASIPVGNLGTLTRTFKPFNI